MANNKNITFNQLEASMTKVKAEIDKKANTNHGTHVPTTGTANNATYLRNDNQWHKIVPSDIGAAPISHGDHVTYSSTSPSAPGTASAGSAANVSRGDHVHPLQTTISGNAGTATKLQTARTLTIGNTGKSFNGSTNVSWTLGEIGAAAASHNHTSLTGVTKLQFAAGSSDSAVMKITTEEANTYLDFEMNDDVNTDMYRWRFSAYDTNGATPYFNLMTLTAKDASSARLTVNGDVTASSFSGNASSATKLQTARKINDIPFDGSADKTIPLKTFGSYVGDNNTKNYHRILSSGNVTGQYTDKSITLMASSDYDSGNYGIVKITLRSNSATEVSNASVNWIVRKGFSLDSIVFNIKNTPGATIMDVFYKSPGDYACVTWTVLGEGGRDGRNGGSGGYGATWTKYNTHAVEVETYTESAMKTIASYTSTLNQGTDIAHVKSASQLSTSRTINGTSFNGTGNITTSKWGTSRTLTIGSTGKSVDGSGNVSWSLSEIGAAPSSHGHNFMYVKGTNTIGSVNDDTTSNWGAQGNSVHWYAGVEGLLHDQPSSWGYLVNIGQSSEVHQVWMTQASGDLLHRGGNGSGWSGSWRTILDSTNYSTWAASKSHTHTNLVTKTVSSGTLTLGTELYQYAAISSNTTIKLPNVSSFTEIHLFFNWPANVSVIMPSGVKWQQGVMYGPGHVHEFVFTYVNSIGWLGGCVVYG